MAMKNNLVIISLFITFFISLIGCEQKESFRRKTYSKNGFYISLREIPEWVELSAEQLPWGQAFLRVDSTRQGFITSYFRDTINLSLRSSQVRIEYFSRKLPNCSTNDSVTMYIAKIMGRKYNGMEIKRDTAAFETSDGKNVGWVEAVSRMNQMWMAWAYIPRTDGYYVALNLTCYNENDFKLMRDKFKDLALSYREK